MEEAAGRARPAPAAHQHSGRAAARGEGKQLSVVSLEFGLAGEKTASAAFSEFSRNRRTMSV